MTEVSLLYYFCPPGGGDNNQLQPLQCVEVDDPTAMSHIENLEVLNLKEVDINQARSNKICC